MSIFLLCILIVLSLQTYGEAFAPPTTLARKIHLNYDVVVEKTEFPSRQALGSLSPVLGLSKPDRDDGEDVNVNLIPNVDAFSLTAVGFGLIAFNFFVLANVSVDTTCNRMCVFF